MTLGHADVLERALEIADRVIIGIGIHPGKQPVCTYDQREAMISRAVYGTVEVKAFDGLVVDAAREAGADFIVRGLRDSTDFNYEMQMAAMNRAMCNEIPTVFLPASPGVRHITATLVRQIAMLGGDISQFVPTAIHDEIVQRFKSTSSNVT